MHLIRHFYITCCCCTWLLASPVRSQNMDINMLRSFNPANPSSTFWRTTSSSFGLVTGVVSIGSLAYALVEKDKQLKYKSYELMLGVGICVLSTTSMKVIFNRPRPVQTYPDEVYVLTHSNGHSFPSGHTSLAFATATSLTLAYKKWYIVVPAYVWAGCVGYSRMYLGRHYPSDVIGGAVVGAGSSILGHWLSKKLFEPKAAVAFSPGAF